MRSMSKETMEKIESYINEYVEENGVSPTVREIHAHLGMGVGSVSRHLTRMKEMGMIEGSGHRGLMTRETRITRDETVKVPVIGRIACGVPIYAEENIDEYVRLPVSIFGQGEYFILKALGDSMIEAGIDDGDHVVIRKQDTAESGQIVVALIEDEATLKRYYPEPEKNRTRLHPENRMMKDIYVDNCIIQGVAVKVIKNLV